MVKKIAGKLWLLILVILAGCSANCRMYSGCKMPREKIAVVATENIKRIVKFNKTKNIFYEKNGSVVISSVNGKEIGRKKKIELLPGVYNIGLEYKRDNWVSDTKLNLSVEAGKKYKAIGVESSSVHVVYWIEKSKTREVVSGYRPSAFDPKN